MMANPAKPYEADFQGFLQGLGIDFDVEPEVLAFFPAHPGDTNVRGVRPDIRLSDSRFGYTVYLELTEADRYVSPEELPRAIRRRNRRHADSRRGYISPMDYLERKRSRIARALAANPHCAIVLLDYSTQLAIYEDPFLLDELVAAACTRELVAAAS